MYNIKISGLSFSYGERNIFSDINLNIDSGEFVCLLGPSGCGKSTLLKLLAGLESPTGGSMTINNKEIKGAGLDRGVVFQDYSLFSWISAGKNITLALEQAFKSMGKKEREEKAKEYLEKVGVQDSYDKLPNSLSGGMRQRVAIARAFAINPPILLMDEPFGALDAVTRAKLQDLTIDLWKSSKGDKKTIIFVTHDVDEALLLSEKIVIMGANGRGIERIIDTDASIRRERKEIFKNSYFINLKEELLEILDY